MGAKIAKPLTCAFGEPWIGAHPRCDAETERACAACDEAVKRGEHDEDGSPAAQRDRVVAGRRMIGGRTDGR